MSIGDVAISPGDVKRRLDELERLVREQMAGRRLAAATLGSGGLVVGPGAAVSVHDAQGNLIARLGDLEVFGPGLRGTWLGRAGGRTALAAYGTGVDGDNGFVALYDLSGNYILTDDTASRRGLARPYIGYQVGEVTPPTAVTTSVTFEDLAAGVNAVQHPVMYAQLLVRSSDASTTGEVRVMVDGVQVGDTLTVQGGSYQYASIGPASVPVSEDTYGQLHAIAVQARRTGGAGTIGVRVMSLLGLESAFL